MWLFFALKEREAEALRQAALRQAPGDTYYVIIYQLENECQAELVEGFLIEIDFMISTGHEHRLLSPL